MGRRPRSLRIADYLQHIIDAVERIRGYTAGLTMDSFVRTPLVQDAVIRNLEVIGEACHNVLRHHADFAAAHDDIPWRSPYEMRNAWTHGYLSIDLVWTWTTTQGDLLTFEAQIRALLAQLNPPSRPDDVGR